jgi:hypothetical protein
MALFVSEPAKLSARPEEEQVVYCVQLLTRKGYFIRFAEAAERFIQHRRRGLAAGGVTALLCILAVAIVIHGASTTTPPPQQVAWKLQRQIELVNDGSYAVDLGPLSPDEQLEWRTFPKGNERLAEVSVSAGRIYAKPPARVMVVIDVKKRA